MPERAPTSPSGWRFRCSECGTGEHLTASALAIVSGRLLPAATMGEYVEEGYSDQTELFEASIACEVHACSVIEEWIDGRWTVEQPCPGGPDPYEQRHHGDEKHYACRDGRRVGHYGSLAGTCQVCKGRGRVDVPVEEAVAS